MAKGTKNARAVRLISKRITMITGLDNKGNLYISLLQANSSAKIMEIFF